MEDNLHQYSHNPERDEPPTLTKTDELLKFLFEKHFEIYEIAKSYSDDRFANYSDIIYEKTKDAISKYQSFKKLQNEK